MIDKAFGLQEAVRKAVFDDYTRALAGNVLYNRLEMTEDEMKDALFALLGQVASLSSYETVTVLLDQNEQDELANTIEMLQEMGNE